MGELENWMGNLSNDVREIPVIYLAIPGTHNSMTYGITRHSQPAMDADESVKRIFKIAPCIIRSWTITQNHTVTEQLECGVRYFDLRISMSKSYDDFYFAHSLYADKVYLPLQQIRDFLDSHPKEVVILDFQHFYGFDSGLHRKFILIIRAIFSDLIYGPSDGNLNTFCLNKSFRIKKSVLIIYRHPYSISGNFWPSSYWPTPWANTTKISKLQNFLNETLQKRNPQYGFVSQLILSPTRSFVVKRPFGSVKRLAKTVIKNCKTWIEEKRPGFFHEGGEARVNVLLGDFVTLGNKEFCKIVVNLNTYLNSTTAPDDSSDSDCKKASHVDNLIISGIA